MLKTPNRALLRFLVSSIVLIAICGLIATLFITIRYFVAYPLEAIEADKAEELEAAETGGPEEAIKWRRLTQADENGVVPKDALRKALNQRNKNQLKSSVNSLQRAGLSRAGWLSRGPQNIGGRTRALVINPANPNIMWSGSVGGGLWKSIDSGQNWLPIDDFLPNLAISSLTIDPNNPNVLYCGTGEGYFNSDGLNGAGIFKSTDQGNTWLQLPNTSTWSSVDRISVAPGNGNIILAATAGGIRRSTDGGNNWTLVKSVQRSFFVAFNPLDRNRAIAQTLDYNFTTGLWFHDSLYSTDGGLNWQNSNIRVTDFYGRIELAYSSSNPNVVYALYGGTSAAISRSTDGGVNFTPTSGGAPVPESFQLWYDNAIWVSPTDPNFLIIGIINLYRSTDGGVSLNKISNGGLLTDQPHPDQHCVIPDIGYNGTSNKRVYICNDGGVFRTEDITTVSQSGGWTNLNHGYQTTQYYGAAGNGVTGLIYGGLQDNGTLRLLSATLNANVAFGGDGGFAAVDLTDENYCYGEYTALQIHRSINRGVSAQYIYSGISDAGANANFIAPFILDPNSPNRMLAGGRSLWRTDNVKTGNPPTWTAIRPAGTDNISAIAVASGNSNNMWLGQNDGKIYKTINGLDSAPLWQTIDDNSAVNPLPNRYPTRIMIDKDNPNIVTIAFGGFSDGNLQRTTDGGQTWGDITGTGANGLPFAPIRGIARHPLKSNLIYVGTEVGIFATSDGGQTWSTTNEGPATVSVDELNFMNNSTVLLAATHGRGVWTTQIGNPLYDFDGDGKADVSVFRPSNTVWYASKSSDSQVLTAQWGIASDKIVPADYNGDGKTDLAVFRDGFWYILLNGGGFQGAQWGAAGDTPFPADYDGDGKADLAVFRNGTWFVLKSAGGTTTQNWGSAGDIPVVADYDNDGKADFAVYRNGIWYVLFSTGGNTAIQWGIAGDKTVQGDYNGDGKADYAVFRNGFWYILLNGGGFQGAQWGTTGDLASPADYDGDGKTDLAVFRAGTWYIQRTTAGVQVVNFGSAGDKPVPNAFVP